MTMDGPTFFFKKLKMKRVSSFICVYVVRFNVVADVFHSLIYTPDPVHLMTFREIAEPNLLDRLFIRTAQISFFGIYTVVYALSPATAHRMIGYIEEEAIHSYTHFIDEVEAGNIPNVPAPKLAIQYWNLDEKAKLKDLLFAIRDDEMEHRDVNHNFADQILSVPSSTPHGHS
jgi:ubiquinol oxidase